jgi:uncharacterized membrane protein YoaK (UPF0700 family)
MFRHQGKKRRYVHNVKIASLLSFVAGIVNVTGYFFVKKLTTNVTGHFAFFGDEMLRHNYRLALIYLLYILSFFTGAFVSNLLVESVAVKSVRFSNIIPVTLEIIILTTVALVDPSGVAQYADTIACSLLFAMGLQNALVTKISNSVVRTTHLTGLFTDLGIELSQLCFFINPERRRKLRLSVGLRLIIIGCFFLGCLVGGTLYELYNIKALLLAPACLLGGLAFDKLKMKVLTIQRSYHRMVKGNNRPSV